MNWLTALPLVAAFAAGCIATDWWQDGRKEAAVEAARNEERLQCAADQEITWEVSYGLQENTRRIGHAAAGDRVRAGTSCVPVTQAPGGHDAAAAGDRLPGPNPIPAVALIDLAELADRQTAQLLACQDFVRRGGR